MGSDLSEASLPSPTMMLLASWKDVSDDLTVRLMRYDAFNHPHPELFDEWKETGECPYDKANFCRAAYFMEKSHLWPGWDKEEPVDNAYSLMLALFEEKNIKWASPI